MRQILMSMSGIFYQRNHARTYKLISSKSMHPYVRRDKAQGLDPLYLDHKISMTQVRMDIY